MASGTLERESKIAETRNEREGAADASNTSVQKRDDNSPVEQTGKHESLNMGGAERTRTGRVFKPAVDIYETGEAVVLLVDMPGVNESSVDVTLEKNVLTIYGGVQPQQTEGYSLVYSEYGVGDYQRSFTISNQVDWERIEGTVKDGVLRLTLPKHGPAETKKIAVKSA